MVSMSKSHAAVGSAASLTDEDLRIFEQAVLSGLEWMWADAALASGLEWFAKQNPLRWEKLEPESCHEWAAYFSRQKDHRPIRTRIPGAVRTTNRHFESAQAAARWVEDCAALLDPVIEKEMLGAQDPRSCFPEYWVHSGDQDQFKDAILLPVDQFAPFQELLQATYVPASTRDRPCPAKPPCENAKKRLKGGCKCSRNDGYPGLPKSYRVCQVLRIEDSALWKDYVARRCQIRQLRRGRGNNIASMKEVSQEPAFTSAITREEPQAFAPQDEGTSEMYLFHGTNVRSALRIASEKIRLNLSKTEGGLGPGFYLAESVTKADEYASDTAGPGLEEPDEYYAGVFAMLVMRVTMGRIYPSDHFFSNDGEKAQVMSTVLEKREYDSVLGDRRAKANTFREFCVYDESQVYTEYVVLYERVYADAEYGYASFAVLRGPSSAAVFSFQVPPYWNNFSKNPSEELFDEETLLRPRGVAFVQRMMCWLGIGSPDVSSATRLENSDVLQEYVQTKRKIRETLEEKGRLPPPESAWKLVLPDERLHEFELESQACGFSLQHFEQDVNEVFLWAPVQLNANGELPSIREAAERTRQTCTLLTNAREALDQSGQTAQKEQGLLLCRAVCGELAMEGSATGADSKVTDLGDGKWCFELMHPGGYQVYPEILACLRLP